MHLSAYFCQPKVLPASKEILRADSGSVLALYSSLCSSKSSVHTMDTTRTFLPASVSSSAALQAMATSEPVAMITTSGSPSQSWMA